MEYTVRKAGKEDLPQILAIYENARAFMRRSGNPNQWGRTTPERRVLEKDIENGDLNLLENETGIHGVFFFKIFADPTYEVIENGSWLSDSEYGVLHRVAGDGSGGIVRAAVDFAEQQISHLRIDTHEDNHPMQNAVLRQGFRHCGTIHLANGDPRLAYERL